jgi:transcriptional regulator with XRE-family HTH domain
MARETARRRQIRRLLALREREGLSLRAIAERSGIPVGTLSWWSHELRMASSEAEEREVSFAEVVVSSGPDAPGEAGRSFRVTLESGHEVMVPQDFDPGSLARLVDTLSRC